MDYYHMFGGWLPGVQYPDIDFIPFDIVVQNVSDIILTHNNNDPYNMLADNCSFINTEWGLGHPAAWYSTTGESEAQNNEILSSFAAAMVTRMADNSGYINGGIGGLWFAFLKTGYNWVNNGVTNGVYRGTGRGDFNLVFIDDDVVTPAFNTFKILNMLQVERVLVNEAGDTQGYAQQGYMGEIATKGEDTITLLIYNFHTNKGNGPGGVKRPWVNTQWSLMAGLVPIEPPIAPCLPQTANIAINNLPQGFIDNGFTYERYVVDRTHSSSYYWFENTPGNYQTKLQAAKAHQDLERVEYQEQDGVPSFSIPGLNIPEESVTLIVLKQKPWELRSDGNMPLQLYWWEQYDGSGTMSNQYDDELGKEILVSQPTGNPYAFGIKSSSGLNTPKSKRYLSYQVKDPYCMLFYVRVKASDGQYYFLNYNFEAAHLGTCTSGKFAIYDLGTYPGGWYEITRDMEKDLYNAFGVHFESVDMFFIRGQYELGNLRLSDYLDKIPLKDANYWWTQYDGQGILTNAYDSVLNKYTLRTEPTCSNPYAFGIESSSGLNIPGSNRYISYLVKDPYCMLFYVRVKASNGQYYFLNYNFAEARLGTFTSGNFALYDIGTYPGGWCEITRDMESDLYNAFGVHFESVDMFFIRGQYELGDLRTKRLLGTGA
ncbi:MAG: hypothetical protein NT011_07365 [Kiritimatiellaeota bacterium]|nr:hypothetical protein [Kiritimatiellota bacterium]